MWYNPLITWFLRSPLHSLLSLNMMLITYTGSKSGQVFTVPVSYVREENTIWVISMRKRTWWRSLRGGAPITLRLRGKDIAAQAEAFADDLPTKITGLTAYAKEFPDVAKEIGIRFDLNKEPLIDDIKREADKRILIRIQLPD